jgi:molecular chaperone GrpE (heat shock protein)
MPIQWINRLIRSLSIQKDREDPILSQNDTKKLELENQDLKKEVDILQNEVLRLRSQTKTMVGSSQSAWAEALFSDLASLVSQAELIKYLNEVEKKEVKVSDTILLLDRILKILRAHGLELFGEIASILPFDPSRHMPISSAAVFRVSQPVRIRFHGIAYQGKILRKAGVDESKNEL